MRNPIQIRNNDLTKATTAYIVDFLDKKKAMEDAYKEMVSTLQEAMEKGNIKKFENDDLIITYVEETYRESFDSKKLKEMDEALYNSLIKMSTVKPSIRIKKR